MTSGQQDERLHGWFLGQLPDDWFTGVEVRFDRDEILVTGTIPEPTAAADGSDDARSAARTARIERFREDTRERRIVIAAEAERRFEKKVSWAVTCGGETRQFTTANVPVMTRLRFAERAVLDTLVDASVARSRSEALAWCVRLVGQHEADWIARLRDAMKGVDAVRAEGPDSAA